MKVKSLRENYSRLLDTFDKAGVKFTESQKSDIDTFILALESKIESRTKAAIKKTKEIVSEKLESQYKEAFESILSHIEENQKLAAKVQDKVVKLNESKKIARKVNDYLNLYVESVLPKKDIVDYGRMQKMMTIFESLKDTLLVNDESVEAKKKELVESFDQKTKDFETKLAKMQVSLNESMKKNMDLTKKLDHLKAVELLESKTKDLPIYEARQIKRRFAEATTIEIEKNFKKVLESIQAQAAKDSKEEETTLEAEISNIIDDKPLKKENDILKGGQHNLHVTEGEKCPDCGKEDCTCPKDESEKDDATVAFHEDVDDDGSLDESINADIMKYWISQI